MGSPGHDGPLVSPAAWEAFVRVDVDYREIVQWVPGRPRFN
jgi:hypothetical protein